MRWHQRFVNLEGGAAAMLTSSGQAANFYAVFNICEAGDSFYLYHPMFMVELSILFACNNEENGNRRNFR